jgi:hypothetical protein
VLLLLLVPLVIRLRCEGCKAVEKSEGENEGSVPFWFTGAVCCAPVSAMT